MTKVLAIGSDHAGHDLKEHLSSYLKKVGYQIFTYGSLSSGQSCDYPTVTYDLCQDLILGKFSQGVLICRTGIGMSIAANKYHKDIRAALCHNQTTAEASRLHNNANVLCLASCKLYNCQAEQMLLSWLNTDFSGEERHAKRIGMIESFYSGR